MPQPFQLRANFQVIVDLPVERDRRIAVFCGDRLVAARQIDNRQADRAQRRYAALENALAGPARRWLSDSLMRAATPSP